MNSERRTKLDNKLLLDGAVNERERVVNPKSVPSRPGWFSDVSIGVPGSSHSSSSVYTFFH